jgi:hypothetical protein
MRFFSVVLANFCAFIFLLTAIPQDKLANINYYEFVSYLLLYYISMLIFYTLLLVVEVILIEIFTKEEE